MTTQEVLSLLARKWVVSVLRELLPGPKRHFQLRHSIKGIQGKVLRETLRFLERDGVLERVLHDDGFGNKGIAYELTRMGRTLVAPLTSAHEWGHHHLDEVHAHQRETDRAARSAREPGGSLEDGAVPESPLKSP